MLQHCFCIYVMKYFFWIYEKINSWMLSNNNNCFIKNNNKLYSKTDVSKFLIILITLKQIFLGPCSRSKLINDTKEKEDLLQIKKNPVGNLAWGLCISPICLHFPKSIHSTTGLILIWMRIEAEKVEVNNFFENGEVVVAQLTAWSLMIPPEDPG